MPASEYQKQSPASPYLELSLDVPKAEEETWTMLLFDLGAEGVEVSDPSLIAAHLAAGDWDASVFDGDTLSCGRVVLRALVPKNVAGEKIASALRIQAADSAEVQFSSREVPPVDWQETWKEGFVSRPIGRRLWIRPRWDCAPAPEDRVVIVIDPGMAFGTGDHPTTEMVLASLENYVQPGDHVIDLGCGSGILAIASLGLGAESAVGVDLDEVCQNAVTEHLRLNGIAEERFRFYEGDVLSDEKLQRVLRQEKGQLVLANISASVLRDLAGIVGRFMAPRAYFICSGILLDYAQEVAQALVNAGLAIIAQRRVGDWVSYVTVMSYE